MKEENTSDGFIIAMVHLLALCAMFNVMWLATHEEFHLLALTGIEPPSDVMLVVYMHMYKVAYDVI